MPGFKVVSQLRWELRSWEWRGSRQEQGDHRWQDSHSTFIRLLLPSLPMGQVKTSRCFFQRQQKAPSQSRVSVQPWDRVYKVPMGWALGSGVLAKVLGCLC